MGGIAIYFLPGGINSFLSSFWPSLAGGLVLLCLGIILLVVFKRKNRNNKKKTPKATAPTVQAAAPDTMIQSILQTLPQKNGQPQPPLLLAAARLSDLPVTVPINLAIHLAGRGTCLLIDLDSKRDALAQVFDVDSSRMDTRLRVSPIPTSVENLSIWPARYFDLLKHTNLQLLLNAAGKKYDHILLYAPYLTVLADRKQIACCSKRAVVFCKQSEQPAQDHLRRLLKACNCKILCEV